METMLDVKGSTWGVSRAGSSPQCAGLGVSQVAHGHMLFFSQEPLLRRYWLPCHRDHNTAFQENNLNPPVWRPLFCCQAHAKMAAPRAQRCDTARALLHML